MILLLALNLCGYSLVWFLVRWKVLRVNLKPNNCSINPNSWVENNFRCSAVRMVFVVQINHIKAANKCWHKSNLFCSVISKLTHETKTENVCIYFELKEQGWKARLPFSGVIEIPKFCKFREILSEKGKVAKKML